MNVNLHYFTISDEDLARWKTEVYECNVANGWFDDERDFEEGMALIHSEIAEMFEAYRDHGFEDVTHRCVDPSCGHDPLNAPLPKPEGVGSEAADILIRLLDEAHRQEIDLHWGSWVTYHNGIGGTFGQAVSRLHRMVAGWSESRSYVLSRCHIQEVMDRYMSGSLHTILGYLVYVCWEFGIDLPAEYERKIAYNRTRGYKHGGKRI